MEVIKMILFWMYFKMNKTIPNKKILILFIH